MTSNIQSRYLPDLFSSLKHGELVSDELFDSIFSERVRRLSPINWTTVHVAIEAVRMLVTDSNSKVLDVGSGPGKFCLIGASICSAKFFGVEQRTELFTEAESIKNFYNIDNVSFINDNMSHLDWSDYNAFYLFNPFLENIPGFNTIGGKTKLIYENYHKYIDAVRFKLSSLPVGTRVATYHGFGGPLPYDYQLVNKKRIGTDYLSCWIKMKREDSTDEGI